MKKLLFLMCFFAISCNNDRPWRVIEVRQKSEMCEYVLGRSNGLGPQLKEVIDTCGKYQWNQIIQNKDL
jgi:hypothetical protein